MHRTLFRIAVLPMLTLNAELSTRAIALRPRLWGLLGLNCPMNVLPPYELALSSGVPTFTFFTLTQNPPMSKKLLTLGLGLWAYPGQNTRRVRRRRI